MFARAMAGIYIHKASNKYVILSLGLLLYTLFFFFSFLFNAFPSSNDKSAEFSYIIEMEEDWNIDKNEQFIEKLRHFAFDNNLLKYQFKSSEEAWSQLNPDTKSGVFENPLRDIFTISSVIELSKPKLLDLKEDIPEISRIESFNNPGQSITSSLDSLQFVLIPLIIFALALFVSILQGATQSNLSSNKKIIESLIIAGAHPSKLAAVFRNNALFNFIFAFVLALVLFLITFYLIKQALLLNTSELDVLNLLKAILIPVFLIFGMHSIMLLWKVDHYLKSI